MRTRSSSVPTTDDHFAMPRGLEIVSGDGATLVPHISDTSSTYCGVFLARTEGISPLIMPKLEDLERMTSEKEFLSGKAPTGQNTHQLLGRKAHDCCLTIEIA